MTRKLSFGCTGEAAIGPHEIPRNEDTVMWPRVTHIHAHQVRTLTELLGSLYIVLTAENGRRGM